MAHYHDNAPEQGDTQPLDPVEEVWGGRPVEGVVVPAGLDRLVLGDASEPALTRGVATAVAAVLGMAVAWGLPLTQLQQSSTITAIAVIAPFVAGLWIRFKVNSPKTTRDALVGQAQRRR